MAYSVHKVERIPMQFEVNFSRAFSVVVEDV